jgi:dipeptidyl aminopeptidase/acylaminoacyl peptidase
MQDERQVDPRVSAAGMHWAHRMVTNGVPLADFQQVAGSISSWEEWCPAWVLRGGVHFDLGAAAESEGRLRSAGDHFQTASVCYHFGKFLFVHDLAQMRVAHELSVASRLRALPYLNPRGERVLVPFEGTQLVGTLRKPVGVERAPIVVMCMGLDSTKEEMSTNEAVFLERGLATLAFDGPGQGEAEYSLPIRPDYEAPVAAVIDYLEERDDVNASRVGLWGVSLGGYYAPRAAAFEKRVMACISLTGPFDFAEAFAKAPALTRTAFTVRSHSKDETDALKIAESMNLSKVAKMIECPIYIVGGALDRVIPPDHSSRLAQAVSGPVTLNMVEDGTHVVNNRPYKYRPQSADWMAKHLFA